MQTEDRWHSGFDTGVILANGSCRQNVNIGGGRTSAVPSDFTGSMKRGDSGKFSSGVLSFKFDSSITIAANNYLKSQSVLSEKGSGKSQSISTAAQWLIQVYLPQNYPAKFPQELLE